MATVAMTPLLQRLIQMQASLFPFEIRRIAHIELQSRAKLLIPKTQVPLEMTRENYHSSTQSSIHVFSNPVFRPNEVSMGNIFAEDFAGLHPSVQVMFAELNHLSALTVDTADPGNAKEDISSFSQMLDAAEQRMFRMTHCEPGEVNSPSGAFFRMRAYPTSGTIFLYLYLRKTPPSSNASDYYVANLRDALTDGNVIDDAGTFPPKVLLWVLFMGGIAAEGRAQRQWFRTQSARIRESLALGTWAAARQILARFPFSGADCESHCQAFWGELTR
jgi:hypothetical protein